VQSFISGLTGAEKTNDVPPISIPHEIENIR